MSDNEHPEAALWAAWERGESPCPLCLDLEAWDWRATCDCGMAPDPTTPCPWRPAP